MKMLKHVVLTVLACATLVAVIQNTEVVTFRFLIWQWSVSRIVLFPAAVLAGFLGGFLAAKVGRGRARRALHPTLPPPPPPRSPRIG